MPTVVPFHRRAPNRRLAAALVAAACVAAPGMARADAVVVFAAASLKTALDEVAAAWGGETAIAYAASSALAKQIEQGAPADLFVSADLDWMDYLETRDLIAADTQRNLLGNALVLIAAGKSAGPVDITLGFDLAGLLAGERLALADVAAVPAGRYAKAALESLGVWPSVESSLAPAENVRTALAFVAQGETPFGIVYATDAAAEDNVTVVGTFPADSHPPIVYPVALTAAATNPAAAGFLAFLTGPEASAIFAANGFGVLDGAALADPSG